jgi:UDP-glucose 4-epimerase
MIAPSGWVSLPAVKALVTGGAGFIGSHLVDSLLDDGHRVVVIDDLSTGSLANLEGAVERGARFVHADIRDRDRVVELVGEKPDLIFHLAAQMDVRRSVADPVYDGDVNILGTINLLEAARDAEARFVFASTGGAIYGEGHDRDLPFVESAPLRPDSPYGQSKLAGEGYCTLYRRLYGVDTVSLRLGNVYGPRQNPRGEAGVIAMFCGRLVRRQPVTVFGDGTQTRDYVYIDDVVNALVTAGGSGVEGAYNVGTGRQTSVLDLVSSLSEIYAFSDRPEFVAERVGEILRTAISPAKVEADLGWRPAIQLEDGLTKTAAWVRAEATRERENHQ